MVRSLPNDPPINPRLMGWGNPTLQAHHNLALEARSIEYLSQHTGVVCTAKQSVGAGEMPARIEKLIRSKFQFDSGWNMMVAEQIVYRLTPEQTLMVTQNMGNCIGNSNACLLASRISHEILALGDAEEPLGMQQLAIPFMPYTYGVGRMAGGMLNSRGDGSYCGAQIEGTMKYGFLPCFLEGLSAYGGTLPQSSASVGRLFGSSKREIDKWIGKAQTFKLDESPVCKSADDAINLLEVKKIPLQIASGTMPTFWKVDATLGIPLYRMGTPASHSTQIVASFTLKGRKFVVGRNQWGYDAHHGAPTIGIPRGCYVFPIEELAKWLPRAECIGLGSITGLQQAPVFA